MEQLEQHVSVNSEMAELSKCFEILSEMLDQMYTNSHLLPPMSFKHIQDEETRAHEALRQISNKSLETIQVS